MATKKDVMELLAKGASWNETAQALGCSKATVSRCAEAMKERGIGAEELSRMTEAEVSALFADGRTKRGEEWLEPDYERICEQLANVPKMTLTLQWKRYCDCNPGGKRLYGLSRFCEKVGEYIRTHELSARIAHEPGRTLLVDWAGLTAEWTDPVTGRRQPAYLFVACLPYSGWIWARLFADMRSRSWIEAHVLCLEAMGGVPDILVPDNCATATDRKGKGAPIKLNDLYLEMAQHYGCGIVPARVRRPKDKALAEKAVDLCETWVLAPMSGEVFHSIAEANAEVERLVAQLDARPFQQRDGSRDDAFFGEERAALNPCRKPASRCMNGGAARYRQTTMSRWTTCAIRCHGASSATRSMSGSALPPLPCWRAARWWRSIPGFREGADSTPRGRRTCPRGTGRLRRSGRADTSSAGQRR